MTKLLKWFPLIYMILLIILRDFRFKYPANDLLETVNEISFEIYLMVSAITFFLLDKEHRKIYMAIILLAVVLVAIKL